MSARRRLAPVLACAVLAAAAAGGQAAQAATKGFVLTTDYTTGTLSVVDLATREVTCDVAMVSPDPFARWHDGLLYVVNRLGYDNVQVIDPSDGYATLRQFSTGSGTNPQDIAFASAAKAYVSRLGSPDLLVVDPRTGAPAGSIPLAAWADADGNPEAAHLAVVGDLLFVALTRLTNFVPADTGLVVVIDMRADTVFDADPSTAGVQVVRLPGMNPGTDFAWLPGDAPGADSRLLIGCTGSWGALDGGIAEIVVPGWAHGDPAAIACRGYVITEDALGGDAADVVAWGYEHSYAVVSDASYNTSLVSWDPEAGTKLATLYAPGGYCLADIARDDRGELYVCNSSFTAPGLWVYAAGSDDLLAGPIATCLPPVQIVFDQAEGSMAGVVAPASPAFALAPPAPNPARRAARLTVDLGEPGGLRVEVFDLAGRRVRVLADGSHPAGATSLAWDLRDAGGSRARAGIYLVRAQHAGASVSRRLVVLD